MDTLNSVGPAPLPDVSEPTQLFEDELILSAAGEGLTGFDGGLDAGGAAALMIQGGGRGSLAQPQKRVQLTSMTNEERKRYDIRTVK